MKNFWRKEYHINLETKSLYRHYDFVILGSGLSGVSTAYFLEKHGVDSILIVDEADFCFGASSRNAGFITSGSTKYKDRLIDRIGKEKTDFVLSYSEKSIENLKAIADNLGVDIINDGSYTIRTDSFDPYSPEGEFNNTDCSMNPFEFTLEMAKSLRKTHFSFNKDLDKMDVEYKNLILCTNNIPKDYKGYLPRVHTSPIRAQIMSAHLDKDFGVFSNFYVPKHRLYFRFYDPYHIIIGGMRLIDEVAESTDQVELNPKIQNELQSWVIDNLGVKILHKNQWAGIMSFTKNELPVYSKYQNIYFLGGFSGHGNGFITQMCSDLSDLLIKKKESKFLNFCHA